jgi:hypothetical protein
LQPAPRLYTKGARQPGFNPRPRVPAAYAKKADWTMDSGEPNMSEETHLVPARLTQDSSSGASSSSAGDRNSIFKRLVTADDDVVGLVAYSLYKQSKLDWIGAFEQDRGRVPNDGELGSYIIGEGTARRLGTYRHLAETALAAWRDGGDANAVSTSDSGRRGIMGVGTLFNLFVVAAAVGLVVLGLTARLMFGHK